MNYVTAGEQQYVEAGGLRVARTLYDFVTN